MVTPTSFGSQDPELKKQLEAAVKEVIYNTTGKPLASDDLVKLLPDVDGYIAGLDQIDRDRFAGCKAVAGSGALWGGRRCG